MLVPFGFEVLRSMTENLTTNEEIRNRWNGNRRNAKFLNYYSNESTYFEKMTYLMKVPVPESKLHQMTVLRNIVHEKMALDQKQANVRDEESNAERVENTLTFAKLMNSSVE